MEKQCLKNMHFSGCFLHETDNLFLNIVPSISKAIFIRYLTNLTLYHVSNIIGIKYTHTLKCFCWWSLSLSRCQKNEGPPVVNTGEPIICRCVRGEKSCDYLAVQQVLKQHPFVQWHFFIMMRCPRNWTLVYIH